MHTPTPKQEVVSGSSKSSGHHCGILEEEEHWLEVRRKYAREIVSSPRFDGTIAVIIALNAFAIGLEQSLRIRGHNTLGLKIAESAFLIVYISELALRFFAQGLQILKVDHWVRFDLFLVCLGVTTDWVLEPALSGGSPDEFEPLVVLRTGRLLRLVKSGRLLFQFREFWMLVRGVLNSAGIMVCTIVTLVMIIYGFSSMAVELITFHKLAVGESAEPQFASHVDRYFATLPQTMLTLLQFVTLDDIHSIYRPLVEADAKLAVYFACLILVVSIVIINLITAIIVSSTLDQNIQDKADIKNEDHVKLKRVVKQIRRLFYHLDEERTGYITRQAISQVDTADMRLLCKALSVNDAGEVFDAVDLDCSGQVAINDFCDTIIDVITSQVSLEAKRTEKQIKAIYAAVKQSEAFQQNVQDLLQGVRRELDTIKDKPPRFWDASAMLDWRAAAALHGSEDGAVSGYMETAKESQKALSTDKGCKYGQMESLGSTVDELSSSRKLTKESSGASSAHRFHCLSAASIPSDGGSFKGPKAQSRASTVCLSDARNTPGWNREISNGSAGGVSAGSRRSRLHLQLGKKNTVASGTCAEFVPAVQDMETWAGHQEEKTTGSHEFHMLDNGIQAGSLEQQSMSYQSL